MIECQPHKEPHAVHLLLEWDKARCGADAYPGRGKLYFGPKDFEHYSMETIDFYIDTLGHHKCPECWKDIELFVLGEI